jgi:hypothetical protein
MIALGPPPSRFDDEPPIDTHRPGYGGNGPQNQPKPFHPLLALALVAIALAGYLFFVAMMAR